MRALSRLIGGVLALFRRKRADADLDDELRAYLGEAIDAHMAAGMTPEAATRAARAEMGSAAAVKDYVRDVGWETRLETVLQDVRYALRILRRSPGFAAAAILTFALGIGANTAIFSIVDAAVLRPLPYDEPDRLVTITIHNPGTGKKTTGMMPRDFLDWRERGKVLEQLTLVAGGSRTLLGAGEPEDLSITRVTAGFFEMLRTTPLHGRLFTPADETPATGRIVVLGHSFWVSRFAASPAVIGTTLHLNGEAHEIVGVLPRDFQYPAGTRRPSPLFLPLVFTAEDRQYGVAQSMAFSPRARLRRGVTIAQAEAALTRLQESLDGAHAGFNKGFSRVELTPLIDGYIGTARPWMLTLLGAVGLVLLIACANVANLIIAHSTTRGRELTLRAALGATRWRVARQLLAESLVLSAIGAAAGVALAWWGLGLLKAAMPGSIPRAGNIALDLRVLAFSGVLAIGTGILCGLLPAFHGSRVDIVNGLKNGAGATPGRAQRRLRYGLVWAEVALTVILLVGAALFIASFARLLRVDEGFDTRGTFVVTVSLPRGATPDQHLVQYPAMLAAVRTVPGVQASLIKNSGGPYAGGYTTFPVIIPGQPVRTDEAQIRFRHVSTEFFEVLRVPVVRGRGLTSEDMTAAVAVINEAAARAYWAGREPLGERIEIQKIQYEIVGIARDMRYMGPAAPPAPEVFLPYERVKFGGGTFIVRPAGDATAAMASVKAAIWSVNPVLPIEIRTAEELFGQATAARRFNTLLMTIFGALALVIAATGIYGVIAFVVGQRTREIGVRVALGAQHNEVIALFVRQGASVLTLGIAAGLVGAWMSAKTVSSYLFEVQPRDPYVFGAVAAILMTVGLLACWIPARRAARVDPLIALRAE